MSRSRAPDVARSLRHSKQSAAEATEHSASRQRRCRGSVVWGAGMRARAVLIVDQNGEKVLGPRFVRLLEEIDARGSVRRAAGSLGLGYRHAIAWIARAETAFQRPLVVRRAGGAAGGGSGLTRDGAALVRSYRRVGSALARVVERAHRDILGGPR